MKMMSVRGSAGWVVGIAIGGGSFLLGGCGYTDLEMAAKQRQIDALVAEVSALRAASVHGKVDDKPVATPAPARPKLSSR